MAEFEILENTKDERKYPAQYAGKEVLRAQERRFVIGRNEGNSAEKIGIAFADWNDEKQRADSYIFIRGRDGTFTEVFMTVDQMKHIIGKFNEILQAS